MRMMRACGAGLLTGETGGGGVGRGYLCPPGHALSYNPPSSTCCWCKMYFVFLSLYFFPNANYSNPKQLSLKLSYTPPKSFKPIQCRETERNRPKIHYPRPIHYSQKNLGGVYLCLATPQRCASQLFNQDYSKANLQTKLSRKTKLGAFLA